MIRKKMPHQQDWEIGDEAVMVLKDQNGRPTKVRVRIKNQIQRTRRFHVTLLENFGPFYSDSVFEVDEDVLDDPTLHDNLSREDREKARNIKSDAFETVIAAWSHFTTEKERERGLEAWLELGGPADFVTTFTKHCHELAGGKAGQPAPVTTNLPAPDANPAGKKK